MKIKTVALAAGLLLGIAAIAHAEGGGGAGAGGAGGSSASGSGSSAAGGTSGSGNANSATSMSGQRTAVPTGRNTTLDGSTTTGAPSVPYGAQSNRGTIPAPASPSR